LLAPLFLIAGVAVELPFNPQASTPEAASIAAAESPSKACSSPISDYSIVTLGLRRGSLIKNVDVAIYARNLLDEDAGEPSESATSLPFDLPMAGRSGFGEYTWRLRPSFPKTPR
jgi:hypothetical protein